MFAITDCISLTTISGQIYMTSAVNSVLIRISTSPEFISWLENLTPIESYEAMEKKFYFNDYYTEKVNRRFKLYNKILYTELSEL
jgi:hypothetical protein